MRRMELVRLIDVDPARAWQVVNDAPFYGEIASGLASAAIVSGEEGTAIRRCWDDKGNHWDETCPVYEDGQRVTFKVSMASHPARKLLKAMAASHLVEPADGRTRVTLRFDFELQPGPVPWTLLMIGKRGLKRQMCEIMDAWEKRMSHPASAQVGAMAS